MKKRILTAILVLMFAFASCMAAGCGGASEPQAKAETQKEETEKKDTKKKETSAQKPEEKSRADQTAKEEPGEEEPKEEEPAQDKAENGTEAENDADEWWPKYDSPEDVLKAFSGAHDDAPSGDFGYLMYDVNADGYEELIITCQDKIQEIYGTYKGKYHSAFSVHDDCEVTLYPEGMLKVVRPDSSDFPGTTWQQYYPDYGDFLPVFEESYGEYYIFCAYDLSETDKEEINRSMEDIGEYPVWIGEWLDMISKKDYEKLVPKTKPVKLLKADAFSDTSALKVKPETLLYVKAPDGYANLRTGPGTEYEIICQIPNGDEMEMYLKDATTQSGKKWLKVTYFTEADNEDGYTWLSGWIAESQLE